MACIRVRPHGGHSLAVLGHHREWGVLHVSFEVALVAVHETPGGVVW